MRTSDSDLRVRVKGEQFGYNFDKGGVGLTVDVISAEQTSQTYFTPPSPPRVAVFFRITPIAAISTSLHDPE